jgi:2-phospho-L-lactate guanylyltransferase
MGNLFHTAIRALTETLPVDAIVVVSPDAEVLRDANRLGVHSLLQQHFGLNEAVRQGEAYALQHGAEAVFVLLADLPLATGSEIARVLAHSQGGREAVIVPGQRGGTHALLIRPPGWLSFAFGPGSFERHVIEIVRMGASLTICTSQALAFDIDTEGDLERYPEKSCLLKERDS